VTLVAESFGDPAALATPLRDAIHGIDKNQPIFNVRTFDSFYRYRAVSTTDLIINTVAGMGVMGVGIAMVGLYGLVAYAASRRTREIGIRIAIGAQRSAVLRMVMRQGVTLAACGLVVGLAGSFGCQRLLSNAFVGAGTDWATYIIVAPFLLAVTVIAAYIPARRASRIDPMAALRYE
jgi:putative ABC transport system permease protein